MRIKPYYSSPITRVAWNRKDCGTLLCSDPIRYPSSSFRQKGYFFYYACKLYNCMNIYMFPYLFINN